jgi:putative sigma-54 modulation protein
VSVQIRVATRHGHLSESSQDAIKAKGEKLIRFFERLSSIEFVVDLKDSPNPKVDLKVSAEHKHDFVAHDQSGSLMSSVDSVVQKVEQQLRRYKKRVQSRHRNSETRRQELPVEPVEE